MAGPICTKLSEVAERRVEIGLMKNFFDLSTFKKLTFSEPRMLKLGWWGSQITTKILYLFKKPN